MKRKIITYFMIIILLTLSLVMISFGFGLKQFFYREIADTFQKKAETIIPSWSRSEEITNTGLAVNSDEIIRNYKVPEAQLQLLTRSGQTIQSSTGFYEDIKYEIDPSVLQYHTVYQVEQIVNSKEKSMAVYTPLLYKGQMVGILRYVSSLAGVDAMIKRLVLYGIFICISIAVMVLLVGTHLGNLVVRPLHDIINLTKKMAEGKYQEKIEKVYPYEAGEIVAILNHMGDEILKTERLKSDFIASISHELRTPLTGIKGWIETMEDEEGLTEEERGLGLGIIRDETERLIKMVEDLLDFSKYQADRIGLTLSDSNLDKIIRDTAFQLQKKAEKKDIRFQITSDPIIISGDGDKLRQVMMNLLDNAIKFSHKNSTIHVVMSADIDTVHITVTDKGIGIKKENLIHITESFYKINSKEAGEGLGLAICKNIIALHGGTMQIDSEYEKGTSVTVSLPCLETIPKTSDLLCMNKI